MKKQLKTIISLLMSLILLGSTFGCSFYRRSAIKSYEAKLTPKEVPIHGGIYIRPESLWV